MIRLWDATLAHYDDILRLNSEAVPNVNLISRDMIAQLHRDAFAFRVAKNETGLCGFVLALGNFSHG